MDMKHISAQELARHSIDWRQFMDFRPATLENGIRIVEAYNSSGLHFTLLPDHGCDIWQASYKGIPLTWLSQASPKRPDYGQSWLQQFNGGLLTTCGLTHAGPPETDPQSGASRDLHGPYSRIPARIRAIEQHIDDQGHVTLTLKAEAVQNALFGEQLLLERSYRMTLGQPAIEIQDCVTNLADTPSPLMLLYHINLGYPLIQDGARLHIPSKVYARDAIAEAALDHWASYEAPQPQFAEQVYFHQCITDDSLIASAVIESDSLGMVISWDTHQLPYFTQWKNTRESRYVAGIEPGNCIPEGQNAAQENERLQWLAPGESQNFTLRIEMIETPDLISSIAAVSQIASSGTPVERCKLNIDPIEGGQS